MDEGGTSGSQRRVDLLEELRLGLAGVGSSQASSSTAGSSQAAREAGSADPSAALADDFAELIDDPVIRELAAQLLVAALRQLGEKEHGKKGVSKKKCKRCA